MRERLDDAFGAPVLETYGSHELPLLAWQCTTTGALHVCEDGVILEVLRDGEPVAPGEQGEVVATNLHAYAMPFIRYRLGDVVTHGEASCPCGQPFATISAVQGRTINYFPLPDGRIVHPYEILALMIRGDDTWMAQYQLLQEQLDRIVLRVVPTAAPGADHLARIEHAVRPPLGQAVDFEVLVVDDLPLEQTRKFRPSRSLVRSEYGQATKYVYSLTAALTSRTCDSSRRACRGSSAIQSGRFRPHRFVFVGDILDRSVHYPKAPRGGLRVEHVGATGAVALEGQSRLVRHEKHHVVALRAQDGACVPQRDIELSPPAREPLRRRLEREVVQPAHTDRIRRQCAELTQHYTEVYWIAVIQPVALRECAGADVMLGTAARGHERNSSPQPRAGLAERLRQDQQTAASAVSSGALTTTSH